MNTPYDPQEYDDAAPSKHVHPSFHVPGPVMPDGAGNGTDDTEAKAEWKAMRQEVLIRVLDLLAVVSTTPKKTYRVIHILKHIARPEGSQNELARKLGMDKGELSKIFNALEVALANVDKGN